MSEEPIAVAGQDDAYIAARDRAYELANTGRYKNWSHVAYTLLVEKFPPGTIKRLNGDALAVLMISRICRGRHAATPSSVRRLRSWLGKLLGEHS